MINLLYIDLFCGAGGTTTGVNTARINDEECAKVIACVNHDANAIASHSINHPDALHFTEDIRTLDLFPLVEHVKKLKIEYPNALIVLWASLECTNFSKAKGGQPRDADSRTLAEHLYRYIEMIDPDYIQIENVEEFMSWGDVDGKGRPISRDKGRCYLQWINKIKGYGYDFEYRILNAANFGAYTSRKRFFGIFAKNNLPICWPEPTHCKSGAENNLFDDLKKWKSVSDVLDFDNEGTSIFSRKKTLSDNTLERIYAGLIKFVAGGKEAFQSRLRNMRDNLQIDSLDCKDKLHFLSKQFSGDPYSKNFSVNMPAGAITCIDHHAFISVHYGNGYNIPLTNVSPTITTKDKLSLVSLNFIDNQYGNGRPTSIDTVSGCLTTNPKQHLVTCKRFLMNPQFGSAGSSISAPCFTLIARMDKRPPYLITLSNGTVDIQLLETDSTIMKKIKVFMSLYSIYDIKMRMLMIDELKKIQGFPDEYVLIGTQAEQKKFIGNAVEVTIARKLCEALCMGLRDFKITNQKIKEVA